MHRGWHRRWRGRRSCSTSRGCTTEAFSEPMDTRIDANEFVFGVEQRHDKVFRGPAHRPGSAEHRGHCCGAAAALGLREREAGVSCTSATRENKAQAVGLAGIRRGEEEAVSLWGRCWCRVHGLVSFCCRGNAGERPGRARASPGRLVGGPQSHKACSSWRMTWSCGVSRRSRSQVARRYLAPEAAGASRAPGLLLADVGQPAAHLPEAGGGDGPGTGWAGPERPSASPALQVLLICCRRRIDRERAFFLDGDT